MYSASDLNCAAEGLNTIILSALNLVSDRQTIIPMSIILIGELFTFPSGRGLPQSCVSIRCFVRYLVSTGTHWCPEDISGGCRFRCVDHWRFHYV
jgi:hypothetical protein